MKDCLTIFKRNLDKYKLKAKIQVKDAMADINFTELTLYTKSFCQLTPEREQLLHDISADVVPRLHEVTDAFYIRLLNIEKALPFLEGRLETLKASHQKWLESLFTQEYDEKFTRFIYHVGNVHVKVKLPVEFMAGGIIQIQQEITDLILDLYGNDSKHFAEILKALNAVLGFNLQIMQASYQASTLEVELENVLKITGMSRKLFNNLALAYQ